MQDLLYVVCALKPIRYVKKMWYYYFPQNGSVTQVAEWSLPKKRRINQISVLLKQVSHTFKDVISSSQWLLPKTAEDLHHDCHRACYITCNPTTGVSDWSITRSCHSDFVFFSFLVFILKTSSKNGLVLKFWMSVRRTREIMLNAYSLNIFPKQLMLEINCSWPSIQVWLLKRVTALQ